MDFDTIALMGSEEAPPARAPGTAHACYVLRLQRMRVIVRTSAEIGPLYF